MGKGTINCKYLLLHVAVNAVHPVSSHVADTSTPGVDFSYPTSQAYVTTSPYVVSTGLVVTAPWSRFGGVSQSYAVNMRDERKTSIIYFGDPGYMVMWIG